MSKPEYIVFVVDENNTLKGFICGEIKEKKYRVYDKEGYIEGWFIEEDYQARGMGKELYDKFKVSPPAISQHLKVLREANLVQVERRAQKRLYQINPDSMQEIEEWAKKMHQLWNQRFDRLDKVLQLEKEKLKIAKRKKL